ncbi:MAG: hypothetical protein HYV45_02250 [Candidatus Moranbacteria bacterium]|nr:hypothetical protein [Candidatus Moranbacteria bacterium]
MYTNRKFFSFLFLGLFFLGFFFLFPEYGLAQTVGLKYTPLEKLPGTENVGSDLPEYVQAIYNLGLAIVTLSAVLMLSIGGFMYLTSAGNTSAMGSAKGVIFDALIGLVIALTAWLLLNVINPDLVKVNTNGISATSSQTPPPTTTSPGEPRPTRTTPSSTCPTPPTAAAVCCPKGVKCEACKDCEEISGVAFKTCGLSKCFLNKNLLAKIKTVSGVSGWRVTESWPPTVDHLSTCHKNGTCADLNNSGGKTDATTIKEYYDAFKSAGLEVLYESKDCTPYTAAGVDNCKTYSTMTNLSSFHVK